MDSLEAADTGSNADSFRIWVFMNRLQGWIHAENTSFRMHFEHT